MLGKICANQELVNHVIVSAITFFAHPCDSSPPNPGRDEEDTQSARQTITNVYVKRTRIPYVTAKLQ